MLHSYWVLDYVVCSHANPSALQIDAKFQTDPSEPLGRSTSTNRIKMLTTNIENEY